MALISCIIFNIITWFSVTVIRIEKNFNYNFIPTIISCFEELDLFSINSNKNIYIFLGLNFSPSVFIDNKNYPSGISGVGFRVICKPSDQNLTF